jgi:hypothetical protein
MFYIMPYVMFRALAAVELIMYFPDLGGSKKNRSRVGYSEAKRELYHSVIRRVLRSVQQTHLQGGFTATRV